MTDTIKPETYTELEVETYRSLELAHERETEPPASSAPTRPAPAFMACRAAAMLEEHREHVSTTRPSPPRALLRLPKIPRPARVPTELVYRAPETFSRDELSALLGSV